jgi:hypothetical protein
VCSHCERLLPSGASAPDILDHRDMKNFDIALSEWERVGRGIVRDCDALKGSS